MSDPANLQPPAGRPNPPPAYRDNDGNEITVTGKVFAGLLLISVTAFCTVFLIGHWPSRIPKAGDDIPLFYTYQWFHVNLAVDCSKKLLQTENPESDEVEDQQGSDNSDAQEDTAEENSENTTGTRPEAPTETKDKPSKDLRKGDSKIECLEDAEVVVHFNTVILALVAISGFLGNMIHVATSFTTFVGAGKFRKSWTLWYCVKPFTAAALAVIMYFIFRGGLLNMSDDSTGLNIYGLVTLSLLTGLFNDRATVKMQEVFEALLRPKEERPDPLKETDPKITGVKAEPLEAGKPIVISLMGENLEKGKVEISVEG